MAIENWSNIILLQRPSSATTLPARTPLALSLLLIIMSLISMRSETLICTVTSLSICLIQRALGFGGRRRHWYCYMARVLKEKGRRKAGGGF